MSANNNYRTTRKVYSAFFMLGLFIVSVCNGQTIQPLPNLLKQLKNPKNSFDVRMNTIDEIRKMGENAKEAIPDLIEILRDKNKSRDERYQAHLALEEMGESSVLELIKIIDDKDKVDDLGRMLACQLLGALGGFAREADTINTEKADGKWAETFNKAVEKLAETLNDSNNSEEIRVVASKALGQIRISSPQVTGALVNALKDPQNKVRHHAIRTLNDLAYMLRETKTSEALPITELETTVPILIAILKNPDESNNLRAHSAKIIALIRVPSLNETIYLLNEIKNNDKDAYIRSVAAENVAPLEKAIGEPISTGSGQKSFWEWVQENKWYVILILPLLPLIIYLMLLVTVIILFIFAPRHLLTINEWQKLEIPIPFPQLNTIKFPVNKLLLASWLHKHPRVIDDWVKKRVGKVRESFQKIPTIEKHHKIYIPIKVSFEDDKAPTILTVEKLRTVFSANSDLLIAGDGGIGKTSLACEIGRWAMREESGKRLCPKYLMLPIFIEDNRNEVINQTPLIEQIQDKLHRRTKDEKGEKPSEYLVRLLLKKRRLLLIVDSLSEMSLQSQTDKINTINKIPVNATIMTSRVRKDSEYLDSRVIVPQRLIKGDTDDFVKSYLEIKGKHHLLKDISEFQAVCSRLRSMVGNGDVPALIVVFFTDLIIGAKEENAKSFSPDNLPDNVPDLMNKVVRNLNRHSEKDSFNHDIVETVAQTLAWAGLEKTLTPPASIRFEQALNILGSEELSRELLKFGVQADLEDNSKRNSLLHHLAYNINLINITTDSPKKVIFTIDTLAEYLACWFLLKKFGDKESEWQKFFGKIKNSSQKGFILALQDCCQTKGKDFGIPELVTNKLCEIVKQFEAENTKVI